MGNDILWLPGIASGKAAQTYTEPVIHLTLRFDKISLVLVGDMSLHTLEHFTPLCISLVRVESNDLIHIFFPME